MSFSSKSSRIAKSCGKSLRGRALPLSWLLVVFAAAGCHSHSGPECGADRYCACGNGHDCYLQCNADNCNLECSQTQEACGTICRNNCAAVCHDTGECSQYCGDGCSLECHSVDRCAGDCGAACNYYCHDLSDCGVRVGPNSSVRCESLSTCTVECTGACDVTCRNMNKLDQCTVTCAPGHARTDDGNGHITCN